VIGDASLADAEKARPGIERTLDYLEKLVNDILEKYPAGELPPIDKVTQRNREDIEAVVKGPTNGGRHIYTLTY
jgi:creatinine amidohydrolase